MKNKNNKPHCYECCVPHYVVGSARIEKLK